MKKYLQDRVAIVTGAGGGLGRAHALELARHGARLVVNDLKGDREGSSARKVADEIHALGGEAIVDGGDVTDYAQMEAMVAAAVAKWGRVDILVNNAGIQHVAKVEDFPTERWDAIIAINLTSAFHTTRLAIPAMREANWGRIINVASAHGLVASAQKSAYVAAKHGIVGLTKSVALETATTGVTCNAICPGWVLTALVQKQIDDRAAREGISALQAQNELLGEKQPSLQFTTVEQLGGLAVFLSSPAADQVRGVAWAMDGGWTAQ